MNNSSANPYAAALALGAVCGLRAMMGPALLGPLLPPPARLALRLLSAGELIGDKLPKTPSRLLPGPLGARAVSGAIVGAVMCRRAGRLWLTGAVLGAGAALLSAKLGHDARAALDRKLGLPDPVIAAGEDALAVLVGRHFAPVS